MVALRSVNSQNKSKILGHLRQFSIMGSKHPKTILKLRLHNQDGGLCEYNACLLSCYQNYGIVDYDDIIYM